MEKLVIIGLTDEQTSQLNFIYRKLVSGSESASAKVAEFAAKLTETLHPLDALSWSEPVFKYAAIVEVYRPYIRNIEGALEDYNNADDEYRPAVVARFAKFVAEFEDSVKTRVASAMSNKAFSTMQTSNLADHYKTVALASLVDLFY